MKECAPPPSFYALAHFRQIGNDRASEANAPNSLPYQSGRTMSDAELTHRFAYMVVGLLVVATFNKVVLFLLGHHSLWLTEYSLAGLILLLVNAGVLLEEHYTRKRLWRFLSIALVPTYIGTVFPDIDMLLSGIVGYRNPLLHSCVSYWILVAFLQGRGQIARYVLLGYGIGLCSHLFIDAFDRDEIRWLPGGLIVDRVWLVSNSLLCLVFPASSRADTAISHDAETGG